MKRIFLIVTVVLLCFFMIACQKKPTPLNKETLPPPDIPPDITQPVAPGKVTAPDDNSDLQDIPAPVQFASSVNNILNGSMILYAGDFVIYDDFVENPEDEYGGGEHRLYRAKTDFSEAEVIYTPYFPARNMCIYENKLYFTCGGGGGRHLFELDLATLEVKELHDNLAPEANYFIDFLQLVDGMLYFEYNGNFCRMKPDQTEFEIIYNASSDFSTSFIGVADKYIFYQNRNNYQIRRLNMETKEDSLFLDEYEDGKINIYDGRIYYTLGNKLISSDFEGMEIRTLFELDANLSFKSLNSANGFIYYSVVDTSKNNTEHGYCTLYEYKFNGGEKRLLHQGASYDQLSVVNDRLYYYNFNEYSYFTLVELDPATKETCEFEKIA